MKAAASKRPLLSLRVSAALLLVGATALVSFGCASGSKMAKPFGDFSAATSDATTATTTALSLAQSVDQESQAIEQMRTPPEELKENVVKPIFRPNDLLQRQLALQGLAAYATTLKTLAAVDRSADIQKSFDSLKTSLDSTANNINSLAGNSKEPIPSGVVSGLVSLGSILAKSYALEERDKAIRSALEKSDGKVAKICGLLSGELSPGGPIYDQLKHDFNTQEEAAADKYKLARNPPAEANAKGQGEAKPPTPPPDLSPLFKAYVDIIKKKEYSLAMLTSLATSYRRIAQAHNALKVQSETGVASSAQLSALSVEIDNVKFLNGQLAK